MTIALSQRAERRPAAFDLSWPILIGFAVLLCLLIILPLGWLAYSSLVDRTGGFTLDNFRQLLTNTTFVEPFVTTLILATTASVACCAIAAPIAWLVARTDMPLRRTVRVLVTASFVTPPFLGAVAWDREIGRKPLARKILDEPIVLYRKADGTPAALEDR